MPVCGNGASQGRKDLDWGASFNTSQEDSTAKSVLAPSRYLSRMPNSKHVRSPVRIADVLQYLAESGLVTMLILALHLFHAVTPPHFTELRWRGKHRVPGSTSARITPASCTLSHNHGL